MHRESGCLYRLDIDPTEEHSIAAAEPGVFKEMLAELDAAQVRGPSCSLCIWIDGPILNAHACIAHSAVPSHGSSYKMYVPG